MSKLPCISRVLLLPLFLWASANAQISVVDFRGEEIAGVSVVGTTDANTSFSSSAIITQSMNPGFEGQGTVFGGAYSTDWVIRPGIRGTGDWTPSVMYASVGTSAPMSTLLMWDKSNFLNGGDGAALSLGAGSSISLTAISIPDDNFLRPDSWGYRMVVRNDNTYYISNDSTFTTALGFTIDDFDTSTWAVFDPTADSGNMGTVTDSIVGLDPSAYAPRIFDDVTAAGFYAHMGRTNGVAAMNLSTFELVAIPEPSSLLLLLGAMGAFFLFRGRV